MRDVELYRHLLGITTPWTVRDVELSVEEKRVDVWVEHPEGLLFACPDCQREWPVYDHGQERVWRHLDSCQFHTFLHARPPRVHCPEHGVKTVPLPWAEMRSRFTLLFERMAIDVLKACDTQAAARLLGLSWDEAHGIKRRAVERGMKARPPLVAGSLGVDEKAFKRGHRYVTVVSELGTGHVRHVVETRTKEALSGFYAGLSAAEKSGIEAVAMDMWPAFITATKEALPEPDGKIVFDRFHIMGKLTEAVDKVRRSEHQALLQDGDTRLKGSKYLWLRNVDTMGAEQYQAFSALKDLNLKTSRAWAIKEMLKQMWSYRSKTWARKFFDRWYYWATHSRLAPVVAAAKTVKRHLEGLLNYCQHPITNATAESINAKIQKMICQSRGYRNIDNFKADILFHCGGLNLYPATHAKAG
ncbi:MAG: ISL3 family transposase [Pseudomonadota bacterium]